MARTLKLKFLRPIISIRTLEPIELPQLTVLTGPNGSGKTHLFQAISEGAIEIEGINQHSIRSYSWQNLIPADTGATVGITQKMRNDQIFDTYRQIVSDYFLQVESIARETLPPRLVGKRDLLLRADENEIALEAHDTVQADIFARRTQKLISSVPSKAAPRLGITEAGFTALVAQSGRNALSLTRDDFDDVATWGETNLFQQSFGELFATYRNLWVENELKRAAQTRGQSTAAPLTDDEFRGRYMVEPWIFVNQAFRTANLPFEINTPNMYAYDAYQPRLKKTTTGAEVSFNELSSGEKVLMSLAFGVYYAHDRRQIAHKPALLLLDEIDAPLHPAMAQVYLRILKETLVEQHDMSVIAATHSATTVAMAPEDSIYLMDNEQGQITKLSKNEAINRLSVGVPTLSVSFDGRRQVFVESPIDAEVYDLLYQVLRPHFNSARSLAFISTGTRTSRGDVNTGCDLVRKIVEELAAQGNQTVFGLIDWDGVNHGAGRIAVLAARKRNGLENALLDPLLASAMLLRHDPDSWSAKQFPRTTFTDLLQQNPSILQTVVDHFEQTVFGRIEADRAEVSYLGGFTLRVGRSALHIDDHEYETAILKALPSLNSISRGRSGSLCKYAVSHVLADKPEFAPLDLFDSLSALLSMDP